jgi:hypothetical protein
VHQPDGGAPRNFENPLEGAAIDGLRCQGAELDQGIRDQRSPVDGARHIEKDRKTAQKDKVVLAQLCQRGKEPLAIRGGVQRQRGIVLPVNDNYFFAFTQRGEARRAKPPAARFFCSWDAVH